jgi:hypothetical protein
MPRSTLELKHYVVTTSLFFPNKEKKKNVKINTPINIGNRPVKTVRSGKTLRLTYEIRTKPYIAPPQNAQLVLIIRAQRLLPKYGMLLNGTM